MFVSGLGMGPIDGSFSKTLGIIINQHSTRYIVRRQNKVKTRWLQANKLKQDEYSQTVCNNLYL